MFKRNYTISLIDDGSQGKEWWDATDYNTIGGKKLPDKNSFAHIFCAVNTFGQDDVYKQPKTPKVDTGEYNALCFYGDELPGKFQQKVKATKQFPVLILFFLFSASILSLA